MNEQNLKIEEFSKAFYKIDKGFYLRFIIGVVCLAFLLKYIETFNFNNIVFGTIILVFTFIALTLIMAWVIRKKNTLALKYGIICKQCNKIPKPINMLEALSTSVCPYCGGKINA